MNWLMITLYLLLVYGLYWFIVKNFDKVYLRIIKWRNKR